MGYFSTTQTRSSGHIPENDYPRSASRESGSRFFSPDTGSWLSKDPIAERGGLNLYGFCGNEPVGRVDLFGMGVWDITEYLGNPETHPDVGAYSAVNAKPLGFQVTYVPFSGECSEGTIVTFQIITTGRIGNKRGPTVDYTEGVTKGPGAVPPQFSSIITPPHKLPPSPKGQPKPKSPVSYWDPPTLDSELTAVAVCRDKCNKDTLLSTYHFEWDGKTRKVIKGNKYDRRQYNKAMETWEKEYRTTPQAK